MAISGRWRARGSAHGSVLVASERQHSKKSGGARMTGTGLRGVLAPMVGLLAASLLLLLVGPDAKSLVCGPSWSTVSSGAHLRKPSAIATIASNDIWIVGS